ncbi:MAG: hypothetical protein SFY56_16990 [Bacteroidota bacterium]|nr:hypothetical protein [Bacteroidota bacterium]
MVEISSPCNKNFAKMPKEGNGRFCSACEKVVLDFTNMTNTELQNYFKNYPNEEICGRVKSIHLGKQNRLEFFLFSSKQFVTNKISSKPLRLALLGLLSGLITFTSSCMGKVMPVEKVEKSNNDSSTVKNPATKKN